MKSAMSLLGAVGTIAGLTALAAGQSTQVLAVTGDAAPGGGGDFVDFGVPAVGNLGFVVFRAEGTTANGIWSNGRSMDGSLELLASTADMAPGTAANFLAFGNPLIDADGFVAFSANTDSAGADATGIWSSGLAGGNPGTLSAAVLGGQDAAGAADGADVGSHYWLFSDLVLNDLGEIAFSGLLRDNADAFTQNADRGIWATSGGVLGNIALEGTALVALVPNFFFNGLSLNNAGTPGFGFDASGTQAVSLNPVLIDTTTVAFDLDSTTWETLSVPRSNSDGSTVFAATLAANAAEATGAVDATNDAGIWVAGFSTNGLIAREGDTAPGSAAAFASFGQPLINESGTIVFGAMLDDGSSGIWRMDDGGMLEAFVLTGDTAPSSGFTGIERPTEPKTFVSFGTPTLNANEDMVFIAKLAGDTVTIQNDMAMFYYESGSMDGTLVVQTNDEIDLGGGMTTVLGISMATGSGGGDGRASSLSDFGKLVYSVSTGTMGMPATGEAIIEQFTGSPCISGFDVASPFQVFDQRDLYLLISMSARGMDISNAIDEINGRTIPGVVIDADMDGALDFFDILAILGAIDAGTLTCE